MIGTQPVQTKFWSRMLVAAANPLRQCGSTRRSWKMLTILLLLAVCLLFRYLAYLTVALIVFRKSGHDPKALREVALLWPWGRK